MAMLAEPRQKRRYHLTPKGKPLFEDTDRFGTKMLEKMGWSKGKGLGKSEDGTQDFVRVKYKSDERGLGFQVRDDQWTEHDKNFNGLLQNLNGSVDGNGDADPSPEECDIITPTVGLGFAVKSSKNKKLKEHISGQSLEEKSKKSKARVHYQKFTKGKDMSQYSEKDLANIFGKKASPEETNIYSQFQAFNAGGSDSDDKKVSEPEEPVKVLAPIINTGVSVTDYFKAKMAALKEKQGGSESSNPFNSNVRVINNVEYVIPSSKRKRSTDENGSEDEEKKVPSKKSKTLEEEEPQEQESEEAPPKKKKKKSKKHSDESDETAVIPSEDVEKEESQKEKKKKKRKKAAESEDTIIDEIKEQESISNEHQPDSNSESSSSKKNKKKSKKSREENTNKNEEDIQTTSCPPVVEDDDVPKKKKKKDKKNSIIIDLDSEKEEEEVTPKNTNDTPKSTPSTSEVNNIKSTKSKMKKNKKSKTEVSSQKNKDLTSQPKNFLLDSYTISTFCAEKFRNIEAHKFEGSNLMIIDGYGLSTKLKLNIKKIPGDADRIIKLWSGTLDKYTHSSSKLKIYTTYMKKVKLARRTNSKIPDFKFKTLKRKNAFQCF